ncbi:MAG TPA: long-chain fatty acid--CoA ligase [Candidatus Sulfotelmatobacter sp.]|nr:long-chain fatty acid--CoA ligase [Candidatus Sulfotelmatobacter sp.]
MKATMMSGPLLLDSMLERAYRLFPNVEIVSAQPNGSIHRCTYRDLHRRARQLSAALLQAGIRSGDRVATLMWNEHEHLEAYFGVPATGAVLHTLNLRLHPDELTYIVNHAEDRFLIVDDVLLDLFEKIRPRVHFERVFVTDHGCGVRLPEGAEPYENFLSQASGEPVYPVKHEEDAATMCYTSGTTGVPKGVLYSHRALALHTLSMSLPDQLCFSCYDTALYAMSMFHANAWGVPYAATMNGCKQVLPGRNLQPEALLDLLQNECVTLTGGVPTVWLPVLHALDANPGRWKLVPGMRIVCAGSAVPESMFRRFDKYDVRVIQPWGMTETAPLATVCTPKPHMQDWSEDDLYNLRAKQGLASPFIETRAIGIDGEIPWDGQTAGELEVRGPWVASSYYNLDQSEKWTPDGWFRTGDVVTIDSEGYIKITDRAKDMIKSGGEWISSIDLENAIIGHPAVKEAAVVAVAHPKWQERPLAVIVLKDGLRITEEELRAFLEQRFARWQVPDAYVFVNELPHTSTGKLLKTKLRKDFANWFCAEQGRTTSQAS